MPARKILGLLTFLFILISGESFCQDDYLYHDENVASPRLYQISHKRYWKSSIDAGLVFGFTNPAGYTSSYVNGVSTKLGYTFGLFEEIPVQRSAYIDVGIEILEEQVTFNSYFFAPGYSVVYDGSEVYYHDIAMNEIQIPVLYKFRIGATDRRNRCLFGTFGPKFRYISYTNSTVTNTETGYLAWQGQKDVTSLYQFFSPFGSPILEMSLGYQRNRVKKKRRGWYMSLEYNYGIFPLVYSGNRDGSNYVIFHLNSLILKVGKIF